MGRFFMNAREKILILTRIAFLYALILAVLSVQLVIPFSAVLWLIIIPAIIGLAVYHTPSGIMFFSLLILVGLSFILFGIVVVTWMLIYSMPGILIGAAWRSHLMPFARRLFLLLAYWLGVALALLIFSWMAQFSFQEIYNLLTSYPYQIRNIVYAVLAFGFVFWGIINTISLDTFFSRIIGQLYLIRRGSP